MEREKLVKELECCETKFEEVIEERDRDQGLIRGNERAIKVLRRERDELLEKVETGEKLRANLVRERDEVRARAGQLEGVVMGLERRVVEAQGIIEGAEGAEKRAKEAEKRAKEAEKHAQEEERRAEEARERLEGAERRAGEAMAIMEARVNCPPPFGSSRIATSAHRKWPTWISNSMPIPNQVARTSHLFKVPLEDWKTQKSSVHDPRSSIRHTILCWDQTIGCKPFSPETLNPWPFDP